MGRSRYHFGVAWNQAGDLPVSSTAGPTDAPPLPSDPDEVDLAGHPDDELEGVALQHLIGVQQDAGWEKVNPEIQNHMHMLTCAAIALDIEERRAL